MSGNKVWVTWKSDQGEIAASRVIGLDDKAIVDDLRREFVNQRRWKDRDPGTLTVREREGGEKLEEDKELTEYFITASGSSDNPGRSKG